METLRKDSAFNFFDVLHLQRYLEGHNGYIAGGCFKNIFKKEKAKDIDVFFENEKDFEAAVKLFNENEDYTEIYDNENAIGYFDERRKVSIDLVKSEFLPPDEMISGFDFTITKFALYKQEVEVEIEDENEIEEDFEDILDEGRTQKKQELLVMYHQDFFQHLTLNRLVIDGDSIQFPLNTFDRMLRYAKYGYAPCTGSKAKIVRAINLASLPDDDTNLFRGFYVGID